MTADAIKMESGSRPDSIHPVYIIPLLICAWSAFVTVKYHPVAPFIDQWMFLGEYQTLLRDGFSFDWLFAAHNEHRIATSRPLFLVDLLWFGGRNNFLVICNILIQASVGWLFIKLAGYPRNGPRAFAIALALALLFCLPQYQNFLQGFQVGFVGVFALGGWAIWLFCSGIGSGRTKWSKVAGAWGLLVLATFTMANGFLAGFAMVLVCVLWHRARNAAISTAFVSISLAAIYLGNAHASDGQLVHAINHPIDVLLYFLTYLGGILGAPRGWATAAIAGVLGTITAVLFIGLNRRDLNPQRWALVGIMIFIWLSAAMTAAGRASFGLQQALESRYMTPSAHFWAALAILLAPTVAVKGARYGLIGKLAGLTGLVFVFPLQLEGNLQSASWSSGMEDAGDLLAAGTDDAKALRVLCNGNPDLIVAPSVMVESLGFLRSQHLSVFASPAKK